MDLPSNRPSRSSACARRLAALLSAPLILASPGPGAYEAAAQVVPVDVAAPVGGDGTAGAAASGSAGRAPFVGGAALRLELPTLARGLSPAPGLDAAPGTARGTSGPALQAKRSGAPAPVASPGAYLSHMATGTARKVVHRFALYRRPAPRERTYSFRAAPGGEDVPRRAPSAGRAASSRIEPAAAGAAASPPGPPAAENRLEERADRVSGMFDEWFRFFGPREPASPASAARVPEIDDAGARRRARAPTLRPPGNDALRPASADSAASRAIPEALRPPRLSGGAPKAPSERAGLGAGAVRFIAGLVVAQIGVEALGASVPTLVQKQFGDVTAVAQLAIFSSIAGIVGRQIGSVASERFGLKKTYLASSALRLVSISILAGLLATGHMTLPLMMAFYSINGFLGGIAVTAEQSIPPALIDPKLPEPQRRTALEKFWTWEQTTLETVGVSGPIATGAVVASFGFLPALFAFPLTFGVAIAWFALTLRLPPEGLRAPAGVSEAPASRGLVAVFREFFRKIGRGARLVWDDPVLRTAFLAYTLYMMLNPFLYNLMSSVYALRLVANPEHATAVAGWLTGLYSLGGLLGGLLMMREQKRIRRGREDGTIDDPKEARLLRTSMFRWMVLGAAGLAALATLAFPLPTLGLLVHLPPAFGWTANLSLPALALIPFGVAQVVSTLKLRSLFQSRVPEGRMADAMGFHGSASLAITTVGLLGLKYLFKALPGFAPFAYLSAGLLPLGLIYLALARRLRAQTAPPLPHRAAGSSGSR